MFKFNNYSLSIIAFFVFINSSNDPVSVLGSLNSIPSSTGGYSNTNNSDQNEYLNSESIAGINSVSPLFPNLSQYTERVDSVVPLLPWQGIISQNYTPCNQYNPPFSGFNNSTHTFNYDSFYPIASDSPTPLNAFFYNRRTNTSLLIPNSTTNSNRNNSDNTLVPSPTNQINEHGLIEKTENKKSYICVFCGKVLANSQSLKYHLKTLHNPNREKTYRCLACDKGFYSKRVLDIHQKRLHNPKRERPHKCYICRKGFTEKYELNVHLRTHTKEKPYSCSICNRCFAQTSTLKTHERTHTGEKKFQCRFCPDKLASRNSLRNHEDGHLNIKRFQCDKKFRKKAYLKDHIKTHTEAKPHKCNICKKAYVTSDGLRQHLKTHTTPAPYRCNKCDMSFHSKGKYKTHLKYEEETDETKKCDIARERMPTNIILQVTRRDNIDCLEMRQTCMECFWNEYHG